MTDPIKVLTANIDKPNSASIDTYGDYAAARKALAMKPEEVINLVKDSELRGRGGAGFPTGMKWSFVPKNAPKPTYLLCNADESEPGTFKDRVIIEQDPHLLLEGMLISAYAIGSCPMAYIYIRGEFYFGATVLDKALEEARAKGFLGKNIFGSGFDFDMTVHRGAGAYICGEETGLIESLEGHRGQPRVKPPFPAVVGVFGGPTVVNNVETLACVPLIVKNGAEWFKGFGTPKNTGPKLYCVSGNVKKPGVYEFPMGINLKELIYDHCGGITGDRKLKAVIPGGASAPMLLPDEIDLPLNFDAVMKAGSMLGSAGIIVLDESVCIVDAVWRLAKFFAHESCGQCTPCREGTNWLESILDRLERGEGRPQDADLLLDMSDNIGGKSLCALGDAAIGPVISSVRKFRDEYVYHVTHKSCLPGTRRYRRLDMPVAAH
ncbi:MAG: NADH-quinone oxidoreductase subunit [Acidobacteriota bacterium]|jgi:NADH-quinone oxidoreductase subunit F|nr:NADH-quinone oxidoreductase subunit [Acidobacteriota bacterium]